MRHLKKILILILLTCFLFNNSIAAIDHIDGLDYSIKKINDPPLQKNIAKKFDLYELYFENKSSKTFSVPGYSIDLGLEYASLNEIASSLNDKASKKLAVFNIAAGAASIALGGIAKTAANTAMRSVGAFNKRGLGLNDDENVLSPSKIYIFYPGESRSLFLFVDKYLNQKPAFLKFVCRSEEENASYVVINDHLKLEELNAGKQNPKGENVIAVPSTDVYK